jgi:surface carbohydrate biosynthesis protein
MKKRIYLLLEVKSRELDSRLFFSILGTIQNYSIVICKKFYLLTKLKYLRPGIVILKSMGSKNNKMIIEAKKYGHKICLMDEEGLLFWNPEIYCRKRIDPQMFDLINYIFLWGKNDFKAIKKIYPNHEKKLKITGNPRIDLLHPKYKKIYKADAFNIKKIFGDFVLINTNFGYANHITYQGQSIIAGIIKSGVKDQKEILFHKNKLSLQKIRFKQIVQFVRLLTKKNKKINIVIRPHQSENITIWENKFKKYQNVKIVKDGKASIPWMMASKVIISCNCTTGVEAKILKLNSINFIPGNNNVADYKLPNKMTSNIKNIYSLIELTTKYLNNKRQKVKNIIENNCVYYIDNFCSNSKTSVEKILKNLNALYHDMLDKNDKFSNKISFYYFLFKRYLAYKIHFMKFKNNRYSQLLLQKNPGTSIKEIKEKINFMCETLAVKKPSVKEIYPDIYVINK